MRRFDDFLKLLLAVVVGQFFRESTAIAATVYAIAPDVDDWVAEGMPFMLAALAVRNVHAAIRYDAVCDVLKWTPSYEQRRSGRVFSFLTALVATVAAPAIAQHLFASHPEFLKDRELTWIAILFGPYVLYGIWDLALWIGSREQPNPAAIDRVIGRWLVIDAFHLSALAAWAYVLLASRVGVVALEPSWILEGFFVVAAVTIFGDYWMNRAFYFDDEKTFSLDS